jgi:phosphoribosylglycinamide formyltransferase 1
MPNSSIAVLISGGGTTLKNLLSWHDRGNLDVRFSLVISSNENAAGIQYANEAKIPVEIVKRKSFADPKAHSEAVFKLCRKHHVKLVVMGGYLEHLAIPADYENRVINIHPSLIPAFCGKGYYGERVHKKVLEMGAKLTGCTVHFVDNEYDHGPIIAQRSCAVLDGDTPQTLQRRVFELECQLYPEVIDVIVRGRVTVEGRHVKVRGIV